MKHITFLILIMVSFYSNAHIKDLKQIIAPGSKIKDKKVLVYFWASWCPNCRFKMKNTLPQLEKENKIKVITLNIDKSENRMQKYINKYKIELPVYTDPKKVIQSKLNVKNVPAWAILEKQNKDYKIVHFQKGFNKDQVLSYFQ